MTRLFAKLTRALLAGTLAATPMLSSAVDLWCSGAITHVWMHNIGNVYIHGTWRNDHTQICNVNVDWKGVSPTVCKGWYALAMSAVATGKPVTVRLDAPSCAAIAHYESAPAPMYLMLLQ